MKIPTMAFLNIIKITSLTLFMFYLQSCNSSTDSDTDPEKEMIKNGDTSALKDGTYYGSFSSEEEDEDGSHTAWSSVQIKIMQGYVSEIRDSESRKLILDIHHIAGKRLDSTNSTSIRDAEGEEYGVEIKDTTQSRK